MVVAENKYQEVNNEVDQSIGNDIHLPFNCFKDPQCTIPAVGIDFCCQIWPPTNYFRDPFTGYCCSW